MRRYTFYLSVGLLAFGIGFYFVYGLALRKSETLSESVIPLNIETPPMVYSNQEKEKSRRQDYLSNEQRAYFLFENTINKWLSGQKITVPVEPSAETLEKIIESKLNIVDERGLLESAKKVYKPSLMDANGDGKPELTISSNCLPNLSCEFWIFKKVKDEFKVILNTPVEVENFSLRKSKTKAYFDVQTTHSYSQSETTLGMAIHKFDGEQYVLEECYEYQHLYRNKNGKMRKIEKPKLIPLHCC